VRTDGEIDPKSRMVGVVARVEDPYGRDASAGDRPPLAVGLFVQAEIAGRIVSDAYVVPIAALYRDRQGGDVNRVLVVDDDERVRFREVEVLRFERDRVVIASGLMKGERICISPLHAVVDGMRVRIAPSQEDRAALAGDSP
jgi:multidrug efflux pump subunit AcrA (membrane-fusion protein)